MRTETDYSDIGKSHLDFYDLQQSIKLALSEGFLVVFTSLADNHVKVIEKYDPTPYGSLPTIFDSGGVHVVYPSADYYTVSKISKTDFFDIIIELNTES